MLDLILKLTKKENKEKEGQKQTKFFKAFELFQTRMSKKMTQWMQVNDGEHSFVKKIKQQFQQFQTYILALPEQRRKHFLFLVKLTTVFLFLSLLLGFSLAYKAICIYAGWTILNAIPFLTDLIGSISDIFAAIICCFLPGWLAGLMSIVIKFFTVTFLATTIGVFIVPLYLAYRLFLFFQPDLIPTNVSF